MQLVALSLMLILNENSRSLIESAVADFCMLFVHQNSFLWFFALMLLGITTHVVSLVLRPKCPEIHIPLPFYDGQTIEQGGCSTIQDPTRPNIILCFDPSTGTKLGEVQAMTSDEVVLAVESARIAQKTWAKTTFEQRKKVLRVILKYVVEHQREICQISSRDSGKPNIDALLGEVLTTCEKLAYTIKHGEKVLQREYRGTSLLTAHKCAFVEYHPLGVLGVISPWNYPFHNLLNHIISGIFAGNGVVCKVSEYTTWSSFHFIKIVKEALLVTGHSPELVQLVTGFGDAGAALVRAKLDKIIFTGSPKIGKVVMEQAAKTLTPVILELGGKDPMVICEDVDIKAILPIIMRGVFQNCGQNCCGVERIYVYEGVYEHFIDAVVVAVKNLRQGSPLLKGESIDCGAMVMPGQLSIIQTLINDAVEKGARILVGGEPRFVDSGGFFYAPTVVAEVNHAMRIVHEEVFGPVMTVIRVKDDAHLLAQVNDCPFGLGSSVFAKSDQRAEVLGRAIMAGMTTVNDFATNYLVQSLPFGGVKMSGFGRFSGPEGLKACCRQKSVVVDKVPFIRTSVPKILQYPISSASMEFATALIDFVYADGIQCRLQAIFTMLRISLSYKG